MGGRFQALAALLLAGATPALAQSQADWVKCARIVNAGERVECYDRLVAQLSAEGKRVVAETSATAQKLAAEEEAAARARAEADRRARFGTEGLGVDAAGQRLTELDATVVEGFTDRQGQVVFLLDNGQVWRQTDGPYRGPVRPGSAINIKRGTLGNYLLTFENSNRAVPVRRIR